MSRCKALDGAEEVEHVEQMGTVADNRMLL